LAPPPPEGVSAGQRLTTNPRITVAEGEGLVMAFHTLKDALLFAMEAQLVLPTAAWPAELLAHPLCHAVYMQTT
jgi:hypothetical protein